MAGSGIPILVTNSRNKVPFKVSKNKMYQQNFCRSFQNKYFAGEHLLTASKTPWKSRSFRKKCPNVDLSLVRIFLYSDWIQENADQKKLRIWIIFFQWMLTHFFALVLSHTSWKLQKTSEFFYAFKDIDTEKGNDIELGVKSTTLF